MKLLSTIATLCMCVALFVDNTHAQSVSNPDISAIGTSTIVFTTGESASQKGVNEVQFLFEELELNFSAYLNPYMRADVFAAIHGTESAVELEQASVTVLRGLPAGLQFEAGRYLLDIGKINTQHPHQWGWMEFPLMHRTMLGDEGARVTGARASKLLSVGDAMAITLSAGAFSGDSFGHSHDDEDGHEEEEDDHDHEGDEEAPAETFFSGRASLFTEVSETTSWEVGGSYLIGETEPAEDLGVALAWFDSKLKWRPTDYTHVAWIFEAGISSRDVEHHHEEADTSAGAGEEEEAVETLDAFGMFTALEYRISRRFDAGGFYDFTEDAQLENTETSAFGAWFAFMPAEESARFAIVYRHETSDFTAVDDNSVTFQFLWSLGPHKPHPF